MLNLPSYSSVVGLNPSMPESSMRRLIYHVSYDDVGLGQRCLVTHTCRERNHIRFSRASDTNRWRRRLETWRNYRARSRTRRLRGNRPISYTNLDAEDDK